MAARFPSAISRRPNITTSIHTPQPSTLKPSHTPLSHTPSRAATIIRRPRRPYTFTQLVQQTDGSTYTQRTTSPIALYKSTKDTRNHILWQPSDSSLRNVEVDEAGKLAAFRGRFGRGWDIEGAREEDASTATVEDGKNAEGVEGAEGAAAKLAAAAEKTSKSDPVDGRYDALSDLISNYSTSQDQIKESTRPAKQSGKKK
ncbi:putative 50s ribosomal protein [Daldinia childiae]|uniref:putative 50s ribosomal protein n=1 Tax=Daldinia childiae TaxID=326645 RepID=UPI0014486324|nr:putative 50s ribosomal protein [Daldinia childiae]KAF3064360.1 putative 50s ribosomal protein [Daldinia childiae]